MIISLFEIFPSTQWNTALKQFVHQLHHVPVAKTSLPIQVQCSHASTLHSAFFVGFTSCIDTTSVLSQARATARLDHSSHFRGDCPCSFSYCLVFWLPLLYGRSKLVIRGRHHLSRNGRSTLVGRIGGYFTQKLSLYYYEVKRNQLGLISCSFRQTNIVWMIYAYASSQLTYLRFRRVAPESPPAQLHDPPALHASAGEQVWKGFLVMARLIWSVPADLFRAVWTFPGVIPDVMAFSLPYLLVLVTFGAFLIWNQGIVLGACADYHSSQWKINDYQGDKSNHIPAIHIPQLYYFITAATFFGWPALVSEPRGVLNLVRDVRKRMLGGKTSVDHPFSLSDAFCSN